MDTLVAPRNGDPDPTPPIGLELVKNGEQFVLRDTTDPTVRLVYTRAEIDAFLHGAKTGEFDHVVYSDRVSPSPSACHSPRSAGSANRLHSPNT